MADQSRYGGETLGGWADDPIFKLNPAKDLSRKDLDALSVIVCNDLSDQESLWSDLVAVV